MSNFVIKAGAGDSNGPTDNGTTTVPIVNSSLRIGGSATPVTHNGSVTATAEPSANTYDVTLYASDLVCADILAIEFVCSLVALNANAGTPICYVKLVGALSASGVGYDIVIPMTPGQIFTWLNPKNAQYVQPHYANDPNGAAMTIGANQKLAIPQTLGAGPVLSISVTPDKVSDLLVSGTIELIA